MRGAPQSGLTLRKIGPHSSGGRELLSAEADDHLIAEAKEAHVFDVLRKPVSRDRVINVVQMAMDAGYGPGMWPTAFGS